MEKQMKTLSKNKHEKGSITLFVLIAVLFFIISAIGIMMNVKNNKLAQEREIHKIQESYQISNQDAEQIYQEELDKAEGKIDIMLIKKSTWNTDKKEYFYDKTWYTTKGEGNDLVLDVRFIKDVPEEKNYVVIEDKNGTRRYTQAQIKRGEAIITENCLIKAYSNKVKKELRIEKIDREDPIVTFIPDEEQFIEIEKGKTTTQEIPVKMTIARMWDSISGLESAKYGWTNTLGVEPTEYTDLSIISRNVTVKKENAPIGTYYLAVKVKDIAGNVTVIYSKPIIVQVDKTRPEWLEIQSSANGNWTNQDVVVTLKAKDNLNISRFEILKNGVWTSEGITLSEGTKQKTATVTFSQDINEDVQFRVIDTSDNVSDIKYHTIRIDKTLPVFSIQTDGDGVRKIRNITIKLDDKQGSGIDENSLKQYQLIPAETKEIGEWKEYVLDQEITIGEGLTGKYDFIVKSVTDKAGNSSITDDTKIEINGEVYQKLATYSFDNSGPEDFTPVISDKISNSIRVTVETKDIGEAGIDYYEYYVDDNLKQTSKEPSVILKDLIAQEMKPYIPSGFEYVEGTIQTGYVIKDNTKENEKDGNEFVWVPINTGTINIYVIAYDKLGNSTKSKTVIESLSEELTRQVIGDNTNINSYIEDEGDVRNRTSVAAFKNSVLEYGGFYVARYEAGIPDSLPKAQITANATERNVQGIPVSKKNKMPWDYISYTTAKSNSEKMYTNSSGRTAMMNSYSWAMILNWMINSGTRTQEEILANGKTFGNFKDAPVTNITEYTTNYGAKWQKVDNVTKGTTTAWLLKTGHSDYTKSNNVYDIAGNLREWTTEKNSSGSMIARGGYFTKEGISANHREANTADTAGWSITYRPILYANSKLEKIILEKDIKDEWTKQDITVTATYSEGLTNLKIGVGTTLENAKNGVKDITNSQATQLLTENAYVYASGTNSEGELIEEHLYVGNIDKQAPEGTLEITDVTPNSFKIKANITDELSGIKDYEYYINDSLVQTTKENTYDVTNIQLVQEKPYIPTNFEHIEGEIDTGYVIQDKTNGNEFVWIPVGKSETKVYVIAKDLLDNTFKTDTIVVNLTNLQRGINGDNTDISTFKEEEGDLKNKKSIAYFKNNVITYGGFYIARYEAGIPENMEKACDNANASNRNVNGVPVVKKNAIPWNYISKAKAKTNAESMYNTTTAQSALMNSYAWDYTMNWLMATNAKTSSEINNNSIPWGVYYNAAVTGITQYSTNYGSQWNIVENKKKGTGDYWLLKTGNTDYTKANNIYDLAGNIREWTTEKNGTNLVSRGGDYYSAGNSYPAKYRTSSGDTSDYKIGYRPILYKQSKSQIIELKSNKEEWTKEDIIVTATYAEELTQRKIGYGETLDEAKNAINNVTDVVTNIQVVKNGYVYAQAIDDKGELVEEYLKVQNIDKEPPIGRTIFEAKGKGAEGEFQEYVVPETGSYTIRAYGASGSDGSSYGGTSSKGGKGAEVYGTFQLKKGERLIIAVGQEGTISGVATSGDATSGAGGGGTFVVKQVESSKYHLVSKAGEYVEPLIVAAGGNGGNDASYKGSIVNGANGIYTSTSSSDGFTRFLTSPNGTSYNRTVTATGGFVGGGAVDDNNGPAGGWRQGTESNGAAYSYNAGENQGGKTGANKGNGKVEIFPNEDLGGHIWVDSIKANEIRISTDLVDTLSGIESYQYYINGELKQTSKEASYVYSGIKEKIMQPYIPYNFEHIEGTVDTGYVIRDISDNEQTKGNEFVWVPVSISDELEIYVIATDKVGNQTKTDTIIMQANDLQRGVLGDTTDLTNYSENGGDIKDGKSLANFKKSVEQYGGFYVARYEAGIPTNLTSALTNGTKRNVEGRPLSQKNAMPWNYITREQALKNAESMYQTSSAQSSLMNSYAFDNILNWIQNSGEKTQQDIITNSTYWGNYSNSTVTGVTKYSSDNGIYWVDTTSKSKPNGNRWILKTGNSEYSKVKNIYDLAGNLKEWTTETNLAKAVARGGSYYEAGNTVPAKERYSLSDTNDYKIGYRAILYSTHKEGLISIEPETREWTNKDLNVNITYGNNLQNYKIGMGNTLEEAKSALTQVSESTVVKTLTTNQYIYAQASYESGELVEEYTKINNIDKQAPIGKTVFKATGKADKGEYQEYIVPATGEYTIKAYGASGSPGSSYNGTRSEGGKGAEVYGTFQLQKGEKLIIAVGQEGTISGVATSGDATSGAGGGGTFVVKQVESSKYHLVSKAGEYVEPLIVAAGGNGGNDASYKGSIVNGANGIYTSTSSSDGFTRFLTSPNGTSYNRTVTATGGFVGGGAVDDNNGPAGGWRQGTESNGAAYSYNAGENQGGKTGANQGDGLVEIEANIGHIWVDNTDAVNLNIITDFIDMQSGIDYYEYYINDVLVNTSKQDSYLYTDLKTGNAKPYIPTNFKYLEGTVETGYVIKNIEDGNEFVWIPVAGSGKQEIYVVATDKVGNKARTETVTVLPSDLLRGIEGDNTDLSHYSEIEGSVQEMKSIAEFKQSVGEHGGFYVARYEAGIPDNLTSAQNSASTQKRDVEGKPLSQKNQIPWNNISRGKAKQNVESMYQNSTSQSVLINSYAWDAIMNWIMDTNIKTKDQVLNTSITWGNYYNAVVTGVTKYSEDGGYYWHDVASTNKANGKRWQLETGNSEFTKVNNIYDLAGNMREWTTESTMDNGVARGGDWNNAGNSKPAKIRESVPTNGDTYTGYRAVLYQRENIGTIKITSDNEEWTKGNVTTTTTFGKGLSQRKVGIGNTLDEAKANLQDSEATKQIEFQQNGYVYAEAVDSNGNKITEYKNILNIDKEAPIGKTIINASGTGDKGTYQEYIVPETGNYTIKAYGASGSPGSSYNGTRSEGGKGAEVYGTFQLQKGEKLIIAVGQEGTISGVVTSGDATSGAGGGGTFVVKQVEKSNYQLTAKLGEYVEPLIVAAGGNGGNDASYRQSIGNGANGIHTSSGTSDGFTKFLTSPNGTSYSRTVTATGGFVGGTASDDNYGAAGGWRQGNESNEAAYSYNAGQNQGGKTGENQGDGRVEIIPENPNVWVEGINANTFKIKTDLIDTLSGIENYQYYINGELKETSTEPTFTYSQLEIKQHKPYIPSNFRHVEGTVETGYVIRDVSTDESTRGNEFVWIPVATSGKQQVYVVATDKVGNQTTTYTLTVGTSDLMRGITEDNTDVGTYLEQDGNIEQVKSIEAFKDSVIENGGFYVARYEAGIPETMTKALSNADNTNRNVKGKPISQKNASPWNFITKANAKLNAESMYNNTTAQSSLINSYAWDTIMNWLITSGAKTTAQINSNSSSWGNYYNSSPTKITKYSTDNGANWIEVTSRTKGNGTYWLLPTGHTDFTKANNIYDLAGNLREWTTETYLSTNIVARGGDWYNSATTYPARSRAYTADTYNQYTGYRPILYTNVKSETIIITEDITDEWTTSDTKTTVTYGEGLTNRKIGKGNTLEEAKQSIKDVEGDSAVEKFERNGFVYASGTNSKGELIEEYFEVVNIDKDAPEGTPFISDVTPTSFKINANINDTLSGIKEYRYYVNGTVVANTKEETYDVKDVKLIYQQPYIPSNFEHTEGTVETGYVIRDKINGNEFVWVPIGKSETLVAVEAEDNIGNIMKSNTITVTLTDLVRGITGDNTDLKPYTETEGSNSDKKSIAYFKNSSITQGGFYVARYEAGIPNDMTDMQRFASVTYRNVPAIPVSTRNATPWNFIRQAQAKENAEKMYQTATSQSALINSYAIDSIMNWLMSSGSKTSSQINSNSNSWGNYYDSRPNQITEYSTDNGATWLTISNATKSSGTRWLLKTGHTNFTKANNIYDLAGNLREWTTENSSSNKVVRGGDWYESASSYPAKSRTAISVNTADYSTGYRPILYKHVSDELITLTADKQGSWVKEDITVTAQFGKSLTNKKLGYGKTIEIAKANMTEITENIKNVILTENGYVYAEAIDGDGNLVKEELAINNIDKQAPERVKATIKATKTGSQGEYQEYIVPVTGKYTIKAYGASGANGPNNPSRGIAKGGKGAEVYGTFDLKAGDKLIIAVGQEGQLLGRAPNNSDSASGGGGGGTFVTKQVAYSSYHLTAKNNEYVEPLIVAAGGNGGNDTNYTGKIDGADGIHTNGTTQNGFNRFLSSPNGSVYSRNGLTSIGGFVGATGVDNNNGLAGGWQLGSGTNTPAYSYNTGENQGGQSGVNQGDGRVEIYGDTSVSVENVNATTLTIHAGLIDTLSGIDYYEYYVNGILKQKTSDTSYTYTDINPEVAREPYIPSNFEHTEGTVETGFIIKDVSSDENRKGNEFVWIPITIGEQQNIQIKAFDKLGNQNTSETIVVKSSDLMRGIKDDKTDLETYVEEIGKGTNAKDIETFQKSVIENGGFYVARYEAGIPENMKNAIKYASASHRNVKGTPIIQKNAVPWNFIRQTQAKQNAEELYTNTTAQTSLMNSYAFDSIMNWLINSGTKTSAQVNSNSNAWGNYYDSRPNQITEYSNDNGASWYTTSSTTKSSGTRWLLKTGHTDFTKANNIYDLAGNLREWTTEDNTNNKVVRGGDWYNSAATYAAKSRYPLSANTADYNTGYRPILYKNRIVDTITLTKDNTDLWTSNDINVTAVYGNNLTELKIGQGLTLEEAKTNIKDVATNTFVETIKKNGFVYACAKDKNGNLVEEYIDIQNIDKDKPIGTPSISDITPTSFKINANMKDELSGIKEYRYYINGALAGTTAEPTYDVTDILLQQEEPYIPTNFEYLEGEVKTGYVIKDKINGNEFVWIPVGKSETKILVETEDNIGNIAKSDTITVNLTDLVRGINGDNTDLKNYTEDEGTTGNKKSIAYFKNNAISYGGYYVGRYEAGIPEDMTNAINNANADNRNVKGTPTSKKDAVPWNYITKANAKANAESMYSVTSAQSGLMNSYAWDTMINWLMSSECKTEEAVITNSKDWGNYYYAPVKGILEYSTNGATWNKENEYKTKETNVRWMLKTGHANYTKANNIYDLAGNMAEWITETYSTNVVYRGGNWYDTAVQPVTHRARTGDTTNTKIGYRSILYQQIQDERIILTSDKTAEWVKEDVHVTAEFGKGLKQPKIGRGNTLEEAKASLTLIEGNNKVVTFEKNGYIYAEALDDTGSVVTEYLKVGNIDKDAPIVVGEELVVENRSSTSVKITTGIIDTLSGVETYKYYMNGILKATIKEPEYICEEVSAEELKDPYIPSNFRHIEGSIETGYVIKDISGQADKNGNEFVWIPVRAGKTQEIYVVATDKMGNSYTSKTATFTPTDLMRNVTGETTDLSNYTDEEGDITNKKSLKVFEQSVSENGGYYVARYEAGIPESMTNAINNANSTNRNIKGNPISQKNASPWNYITKTNAKLNAETMYQNATAQSALMNSYSYATMLNWIQMSKGKTQEQILQDSNSWGNYYKSSLTDITKYSTNNGASWISHAGITKPEKTRWLLATGNAQDTRVNRIYDLAGNLGEWTTEKSGNNNVYRGGNWYDDVTFTSVTRTNLGDEANNKVGYRPIVYANPANEKITLVTDHDAEWTTDNIVVTATFGQDLQNLKLGKGNTLEEAKNSLIETANDAKTTFEKNGYIYAQATNRSGETITEWLWVQNIDKDAPIALGDPIITKATTSGFTIDSNIIDELSGVAVYQYYVNGQLYKETAEKVTKIEGLNLNGSGPYVPVNFEHIEGTIDTGYVVQDKINGNEFVWVPVGNKTFQVHVIALDKVGNSYTSTKVSVNLMNELQRGVLGDNTNIDTNTEEEGIISNKTSIAHYKKSVETYGGFYVARYEAGIPESMTNAIKNANATNRNVTGVPVSKKNAVPWNYINQTNAKANAEAMYTGGMKSTLMNSYAYDTTLNWLQNSLNKTQANIVSDSTSWGNYTNAGVKNITQYSTNNGATWQTHTGITKGTSTSWLLKTGNTDYTNSNNLYDIAGNLSEWTTEISNNNRIIRGGAFNRSGTTESAKYRENLIDTTTNNYIGYRPILYKVMPEYTITFEPDITEFTTSDVTVNIKYGSQLTGNFKAGFGKTVEEARQNARQETAMKVIANDNGYVYAEAIDADGELIYDALYISNIDRIDPTIQIDNIKSSRKTVKATITLQDNAGGSGLNMGFSKYIIDNSPELKGVNSIEWNGTDAKRLQTAVSNIQHTAELNGKYYIHVMTSDNVGHKVETISKPFWIDDVPPEIISLKEENTSSNLNTFTNLVAKAKDIDSGIVAFQFSTESGLTVDSSGWIAVEQSIEELTFKYEIASNGTYYFYVKDAGNSMAKKSITIKNFSPNVGQYQYQETYSCGGCQTSYYEHNPPCTTHQVPCTGTVTTIEYMDNVSCDIGGSFSAPGATVSSCNTCGYSYSRPGQSTTHCLHDGPCNAHVTGSYVSRSYTSGCSSSKTEPYCPGHYYSYCPGNHLRWVWGNSSYTVVYNSNRGTGSMANSRFTCNSFYNLSKNTFTRDGYTFLGWSKDANDTIPTYVDKARVKNLSLGNNSTVTLYAIWGKN